MLRTSRSIPSRAGAWVSGYDHEQMRDEPLTEHGVVTEEQQWENLGYCLERVVPVAEEANVRMAMHPDDPPLSPIRGVARIMSSVENYQRLVDLVPSPANGIALCQGNFTLMVDDLPSVIRRGTRPGSGPGRGRPTGSVSGRPPRRGSGRRRQPTAVEARTGKR